MLLFMLCESERFINYWLVVCNDIDYMNSFLAQVTAKLALSFRLHQLDQPQPKLHLIWRLAQADILLLQAAQFQEDTALGPCLNFPLCIDSRGTLYLHPTFNIFGCLAQVLPSANQFYYLSPSRIINSCCILVCVHVLYSCLLQCVEKRSVCVIFLPLR